MARGRFSRFITDSARIKINKPYGAVRKYSHKPKVYALLPDISDSVEELSIEKDSIEELSIEKESIEKSCIDKLYSVSDNLYNRDKIETYHAVYSGTSSINELKIKYAKFKK